MKKWSPSSGLMEILPQRALQSWLTRRLVSKRACGNERIPFVYFYISRFNCESEKPALLVSSTSHPAIHLMTLGVGGWGRGSLTKLPQTTELPIQRPLSLPIGHFRVASETSHVKMCSTYGFVFMHIKLICTWNALHEDSFWNTGARELGSNLFKYPQHFSA